jgi:membrane fusion protein (multidrug efflux system)
VLVAAEGFAERRTIELGGAIGDQWHVRAGLATSDEVIVSGNEKLKPGRAVTVVELPPPGPPTIPTLRATDESESSAGL